MKKILLIIVLILGFQSVQAQLFMREKVKNLEEFDQKQWSWGYFLGLNSYDFKFDYKDQTRDIEVTKGAGFDVGLIGNMRINEYLDLRLEPGVIFVSRKVKYPWIPESLNNIRDVKSTYIHVPLLLKFSAKRYNNFKPFVVGGVSTSWNLSSNERNPSDNYGGEFRMHPTTYYWEIGFGVDLYLFFFKFTPSIRGVFAINDELKRDNSPNSVFTGNINQMSSRGVFLHFSFQ